MAGNLSDYLEDALLDHFLGTSAYTSPSTVYVALLTSAASDSDDGSTIAEVSGGSYARQSAAFNSASGGATSNTSNIDFTGMPACTVVGVAVCDNATAGLGEVLVHGTLTANKTVDAGDILRIAAGDLDISID